MPEPMPDLAPYLAAQEGRHLDELLEFLRIPSVSRLAEHGPDMQRAAAWLGGRLAAAGLEHVQVLPTGGHAATGVDYPVVCGDWLHAGPQRPTVLLYGHFDVQPVDPLDQWLSPPFQPEVRDGRVYARGASDDKGGLLITVLAVEALLKCAGTLPVNVRCLFEGQEEIGSPQLRAFLAAHPDLVACDLVLCADGGRCGDDPPGLVTGTRGGCGVEITVQGAASDLHSGMFGGAVQNPFMALAAVIGSLRALDGTALVPGFYDDVREASPAERDLARRVPLEAAGIAASLGVPALIGEAGYAVAERLGTRPTLDVLRVWGEHEGTPITPIIPRVAHARVACRLVPDQDPETIKRLLVAHVERQVVPGATVTVQALHGGSLAYEVPFDHPANRAAAAALEEVTGQVPYISRIGGSVPVLEHFKRHLGVYSVVFGFIRDDEGFHAPNEFIRLENFRRRGPLGTAALLRRLEPLEPGSLRVPAALPVLRVGRVITSEDVRQLDDPEP